MAARPRRATMVKRVTASDEDITQFLSTTTEVLAKGYLKKLSSKGKWQQRFFELRGPYFMYWPSEKALAIKDNQVKMPDLAIDMKRIATVEHDAEVGQVILTSHNGNDYKVMFAFVNDRKNMDKWTKILNHVAQKYQKEEELLASPPAPKELIKSGFMNKGGHGLIDTGMKRRFFDLSKSAAGNYQLTYYTGEDKKSQKGIIMLKGATVGRTHAQLTVQENAEKSLGKLYKFDCEDRNEADRWADVLEEAASR